MTDDRPPSSARARSGLAALFAPLAGLARWRRPSQWLFGALLVLDLSALLFVLSFANVTAQGPARRSLGHGLAVLTEIDALLDDHYQTLRQEAQDAQEELTLPDFPVPVSFTPAEVRGTDREQFRALVLSRAAGAVHREGMALLREDRASEVSFFSTQGAVHTAMDFLRPTPHRVLTAMTIALAASAGLLAVGLLAAGRGYGRLLSLGLTVVLPAVPFLVLAVAVRFALRLAADAVDEYLMRELLELGQELTWAPIRNGMIFSVGGAVVLVAGAVLARWSDARPRL